MNSIAYNIRYENLNDAWTKVNVIIAKVEQPIHFKLMWRIDDVIHPIVVIMLGEYYEQV